MLQCQVIDRFSPLCEMTVKGLEGIGMSKTINEVSMSMVLLLRVLDTLDIGLLSGCINAKEGKKRKAFHGAFEW